MQPVRVPQHLELEDVVVLGLSAVDLVCLAVGGFVGWWIWLSLPADVVTKTLAALPALAAGLLLGLGRYGDETARSFLASVVTYLKRPRRRLYGEVP